jgi:hypothetical protein
MIERHGLPQEVEIARLGCPTHTSVTGHDSTPETTAVCPATPSLFWIEEASRPAVSPPLATATPDDDSERPEALAEGIL